MVCWFDITIHFFLSLSCSITVISLSHVVDEQRAEVGAVAQTAEERVVRAHAETHLPEVEAREFGPRAHDFRELVHVPLGERERVEVDGAHMRRPAQRAPQPVVSKRDRRLGEKCARTRREGRGKERRRR